MTVQYPLLSTFQFLMAVNENVDCTKAALGYLDLSLTLFFEIGPVLRESAEQATM